jgi:cytochrome c-type biogenesis protein CcmH
MSDPMMVFIVGVVLVVATLAVVLQPLISKRSEPSERKILWALLIIFPLAVAGVFSGVSTYPWGESLPAVVTVPNPSTPEAVEQMVTGLAIRLETDTEDLEGWIMLGRSYMQLDRYSEALEAWGQAWRLSEGEQVDVAVSYAEAMVMADPKSLVGSAGELLDVILADNPDETKALWYGGMSAVTRGDEALAEERWVRLLADENLPANARAVVQQQLAAMGAAIAVPVATESAAASVRQSIGINIELSDEFAARVKPGQSLFVFAREADGAGPPVAVKRLQVGVFPLQVTLSDADVMMPGRKLSDVSRLRLVARISQSGNAIQAPGDFYGELYPDSLESLESGAANFTLRIDTVAE